MGMPGPDHIIYIPMILMLGLVLGWVLGSRATRNQITREKERAERREQRRRERLERREQS